MAASEHSYLRYPPVYGLYDGNTFRPSLAPATSVLDHRIPLDQLDKELEPLKENVVALLRSGSLASVGVIAVI